MLTIGVMLALTVPPSLVFLSWIISTHIVNVERRRLTELSSTLSDHKFKFNVELGNVLAKLEADYGRLAALEQTLKEQQRQIDILIDRSNN